MCACISNNNSRNIHTDANYTIKSNGALLAQQMTKSESIVYNNTTLQ